MSDTTSTNSGDSSSCGDPNCQHNHHQEFKAPEPKLLEDGSWDVVPSEPGKVIKRIIKEGTGESPKANCQVQVHYTGTLTDGTKFDSSRDRNEPFEFKLGVGQVIKGWDVGVASMKVGEEADFTLAPDYAYGERGSPPTIPANAVLNFNVELISFHKEPETPEEKIAFGTERKNDGNKHVKDQAWSKARSEYERGIACVQYLFCPNDDLKQQHAALILALQLNKALCCIKLNDFNGAFTAANEAVNLDGNNAKALYRRGMAQRVLGQYERAKADLTRAISLAPNDKSIRDELQKVNEVEKKKLERERKIAKNMFAQLREAGEEEERKKAEQEAARDLEKEAQPDVAAPSEEKAKEE
ncbi:putative Peptidyl-prolyl cis-trans isomerase FKBP62 [Blattamonas nauphoetae]|uniref:peptidylprolyl isomerase n=1 Tax=Blattamonas nauphoetae TaxID=2049346 RepID=A0ABQ9XXH9_9EUKA|nr:putative Peptidyl-prolyl cis-trans isomerase FKBP62 [Blattamonas nauphoetae]